MVKLTGKQEAFCLFYVGEASFHGTKAARLAGYKGTDHSLGVIASQNLVKLSIRNRISNLMGELAMSAEEALGRLAAIARGGKYGSEKISVRDALRALELIGKTHKLFTEKLIVSWQEELRAAGVPEADLFEKMVQKAYEELEVD